MADDSEQEPSLHSSGELQPTGRDISRRSVVVGLIGLVAAEAVAGGVWQTLSAELQKNILARKPSPSPLPPCIQVQPSALSFTVTKGQSTGQNVSFTNCGAVAGKVSPSIFTADAGAWLLTSGNSETLKAGTTDAITIAVVSTNLQTGTYQGTVTFTITTSAGSVSAQVSVMLIVSAPPPLTVSPSNLDFRILPQGTSESQQLTLSNTGRQVLNWSASTGASWILLAPSAGTIQADASQIINITVDTSQLQTGTSTAILNITSNRGSVQVKITVTVPHPPIASFTFNVITDDVFFDASPSSMDPSTSIANYHWDFGDGTHDITSSPVDAYRYSSAGTYTVTLIVTDALGQQSSPFMAQVSIGIQ